MSIEKIQSKIITIRNYKIILDKDLAEIYGVSIKRLNQQMTRNKDLFPEDFIFQLTKNEFENLKLQNETSSWGGIRKLPFAYTEYGAIHIAHFLKSIQSKKVSIFVTRAFVQMRQMLFNYKDLREKIEKMESKYDSQFQIVFSAIKELITIKQTPKRPMGFRIDKD
ncbi:MAG TPA: ORF6N domain-containing protein [bacterium]|nr:ORF6N domain-containing protein [bacterium]